MFFFVDLGLTIVGSSLFFFSILGAAGRCLALALAAPDLELTEEVPSVVEAFRKLCGPADPEVCRVLYPDSLRAKYGGNYSSN